MLSFFKTLTLFKKVTTFTMGAVLFGGGALLFGGVGANTASSAAVFSTASHAVGLTFPGGPGHTSTVWAGTYNNGGRGFCLDFGKGTPNTKGTTLTTGNVPGMTAEESKLAKFLANKYDNSASPEAAANAGFAIWRLQADSSFNTWYGSAFATGVITAARHQAINVMLANAAQHAPYIMKTTTTQVQVGQIGNGAVRVLGSNGQPAVGRAVTIQATSAKILTVNGIAGSKGTSQPTGMAFTYQRLTTGKAAFAAVLNDDSSVRAGVSVSSAGHQRTLNGGYMEGAVAHYSYNLTAGRPTITSACATNCKGQATVTFTFANPAGAQPIKWIERVGKVVVATVSAQPGTTGTAVAHIADGKVITTSSYCYTKVLGGWCTSPTVEVQTRYEIVCPAWALGELKLPCNCTPNLPGSVTLTSPAGSTRFYRGFMSINNGKATQVDLVNGKLAPMSTGRLSAGTDVVIHFQVYKDAARTILLGGHDLKRIRVN